MHSNEYFDTIFESNLQPKVQKITNGTMWSETTLVISTDATNVLRQTYPRLSKKDIDEVEFQLHHPDEFGQIYTKSSYNKYKTSVTLKAGHEYYFDVTPKGQIPTEAFKNLNLESRKCKLSNEVSESSIFKVYTKNNCEYECHVDLAMEACKCLPWDYMTGRNSDKVG